MPMFAIYPAEPEVLKQILDVFGEPRDLEVRISIRDERLKELFKLDEVKWFTIQCTCRPKAERVLELYREYYEGYVNVSKGAILQVNERPRTISHFKAKWYVDDLSAEFDGFKLKICSQGNVSKAIKILQLFKNRAIDVEVDLSSEEI
ncbi:MAG: hypothetical protein DRJ51_09040 [Thermoprotei archaeon]|nr:MAG: hypothetical protein DRJ51_09040 [Thermoprotei archaeon]